MGSVVLPHLRTGWHVDQAIMSEEERLVVIRFGIAERVKNFAVVYLCDLDEVPDFNQMYELYDPLTIMFFFRNKHMMCDFGTGNNNKLNWLLEDKQELIDILETIYRGAKKGRGLVVSPKGQRKISTTRCTMQIATEMTMRYGSQGTAYDNSTSSLCLLAFDASLSCVRIETVKLLRKALPPHPVCLQACTATPLSSTFDILNFETRRQAKHHGCRPHFLSRCAANIPGEAREGVDNCNVIQTNSAHNHRAPSPFISLFLAFSPQNICPVNDEFRPQSESQIYLFALHNQRLSSSCLFLSSGEAFGSMRVKPLSKTINAWSKNRGPPAAEPNQPSSTGTRSPDVSVQELDKSHDLLGQTNTDSFDLKALRDAICEVDISPGALDNRTSLRPSQLAHSGITNTMKQPEKPLDPPFSSPTAPVAGPAQFNEIHDARPTISGSKWPAVDAVRNWSNSENAVLRRVYPGVPPGKVHLRGLDNLVTDDVEDFAAEHDPSLALTDIEWLDDTSANLVYPSVIHATKALDYFTESSLEIEDPFELRQAQPLTFHPGVVLNVRLARDTDVKRSTLPKQIQSGHKTKHSSPRTSGSHLSLPLPGELQQPGERSWPLAEIQNRTNQSQSLQKDHQYGESIPNATKTFSETIHLGAKAQHHTQQMQETTILRSRRNLGNTSAAEVNKPLFKDTVREKIALEEQASQPGVSQMTERLIGPQHKPRPKVKYGIHRPRPTAPTAVPIFSIADATKNFAKYRNAVAVPCSQEEEIFTDEKVVITDTPVLSVSDAESVSNEGDVPCEIKAIALEGSGVNSKEPHSTAGFLNEKPVSGDAHGKTAETQHEEHINSRSTSAAVRFPLVNILKTWSLRQGSPEGSKTPPKALPAHISEPGNLQSKEDIGGQWDRRTERRLHFLQYETDRQNDTSKTSSESIPSSSETVAQEPSMKTPTEPIPDEEAPDNLECKSEPTPKGVSEIPTIPKPRKVNPLANAIKSWAKQSKVVTTSAQSVNPEPSFPTSGDQDLEQRNKFPPSFPEEAQHLQPSKLSHDFSSTLTQPPSTDSEGQFLSRYTAEDKYKDTATNLIPASQLQIPNQQPGECLGTKTSGLETEMVNLPQEASTMSSFRITEPSPTSKDVVKQSAYLGIDLADKSNDLHKNENAIVLHGKYSGSQHFIHGHLTSPSPFASLSATSRSSISGDLHSPGSSDSTKQALRPDAVPFTPKSYLPPTPQNCEDLHNNVQVARENMSSEGATDANPEMSLLHDEIEVLKNEVQSLSKMLLTIKDSASSAPQHGSTVKPTDADTYTADQAEFLVKTAMGRAVAKDLLTHDTLHPPPARVASPLAIQRRQLEGTKILLPDFPVTGLTITPRIDYYPEHQQRPRATDRVNCWNCLRQFRTPTGMLQHLSYCIYRGRQFPKQIVLDCGGPCRSSNNAHPLVCPGCGRLFDEISALAIHHQSLKNTCKESWLKGTGHIWGLLRQFRIRLNLPEKSIYGLTI
ncbi:hypothetical protein FH972_022369 [Carpinus fangiana]|uniref:Uncharacterized protein n=1 Tax=Carpinus fangiana TaxID=176857 RepID=A0A5N6KSL8_9ROSI|nr:hypothetical protein FH972_022369 [Carpinus fangiana]